MPLSRIALLLALMTGFAGPAIASTSYYLDVTGQIDHTVNCWETVPLCSGPPHVYSPWVGMITIMVDSAADGTYEGPDFESLTFVADIGGFAVTPYADDPGFSVTVVDGQVSSLDALWSIEPASDTSAFTSFGGLNAYFEDPGGHHTGATQARGTLAPIPEPRPAALLLGALAAFAALRRGRQAWTKGQRGFTSNA